MSPYDLKTGAVIQCISNLFLYGDHFSQIPQKPKHEQQQKEEYKNKGKSVTK